MKPSLHLLRLAALLLAPLTAAQSQFGGVQYALPVPETSGFTRTVVGELNGDGLPDVVQMHASGKALLLVDPGEFEAVSPLHGSRKDLDIQPAGAPNGRDAIVELGEAGLRKLWFDAATNMLVSGPTFGSDVANGVLVRALELGAGPGTELAAIDASGKKLVLFDGDTGTPWASWSSASPVREVVALQWDGQGDPEVAVLSDTWLQVLRTSDWSSVVNLPSLVPGGGLARVGQQSPPEDRLAWITPKPAGGQWMLVLSGSSPLELVDLFTLGVTGVGIADYDGNGFDDVVLSHTFLFEPLALLSLRSREHPAVVAFDGQLSQLHSFPLGVDGPASANQSWPALADLDLDGDVDLVNALESKDEIAVLRGEAIDEEGLKPRFAEDATLLFDSYTDEFLFSLKAPPGLVLPAGTLLRIDVWHQPVFPGPMGPSRVLRREVTFQEGAPLRVHLPGAMTSLYGLQVRFLGAAGQPLPSRSFFLTFNGEILDSGQDHWAGPFVSVSIASGADPGGGLVNNPTIGPFTGGPNP